VRILVVSNLYPPVQAGGYELRCAVTARWLAREHEVLVLTSRRGRRSVGRESDVLRKLPLLPEDWRGAVCAPFASLYAALAMRRLVRRLHPELVFVWNASRIPRAAICVAGELGCPVAFSVADPWFGAFVEGDQFLRYLAGTSSERGLRRAWAWVAKLVNRLPALRIDPSAVRTASIAWNSEALRRMTPTPASIVPVLERVIHPASDHERLFASIERVPSSSPTIAFVGRLEPQKAPDVAVRAVALLRDRHRIDARLVIAGSGDSARVRALERLVVTLDLEDRVDMRGRLSPAAVAQLLAAAHALVAPSRWQEPFGLVCLEAALARVPVVASLSGGMPEMLESESEALFFPIDDVDACAAALARTLTDRTAAARRVRAAFQRAGSYSMQRHNSEYDAFVADAVSASGPTAGSWR
jgi:glycosyltransferase involved in cell wall biosynthesis